MSEQPTLTEAAAPGTAAGAVEFLNKSAARGQLNRTTAQALQTATIKILSIDEDWDKIDLRDLDLDEQFDRFRTLKHNDYSDGSLKNYRSRFNQAVGMYLARLRGDADWKSYGPGSRGAYNKNGATATSKPTLKPATKVIEPTPKTEPVLATTPVASPPQETASSTRSIAHRYPLRDDVDAVLQLPRDLTNAEANRLAKFISTLAWDDAPSIQRARSGLEMAVNIPDD